MRAHAAPQRRRDPHVHDGPQGKADGRPRGLLALQRAVGNEAVCDLLALQRSAVPVEQDVQPLPEEEHPGADVPEVVVEGTVTGLTGTTTANYGSTWRPVGDRGTRTAGGAEVHEGTLVSTFTANPTVALPSPPGGLSPCERRTVQAAIDGPLARHEAQHVAIFRTYAGRTTQPYRVEGGAAAVSAALQSSHDEVNTPRVAATNSRSNAIDPYHLDVDLSACEAAPESEEES